VLSANSVQRAGQVLLAVDVGAVTLCGGALALFPEVYGEPWFEAARVPVALICGSGLALGVVLVAAGVLLSQREHGARRLATAKRIARLIGAAAAWPLRLGWRAREAIVAVAGGAALGWRLQPYGSVVWDVGWWVGASIGALGVCVSWNRLTAEQRRRPPSVGRTATVNVVLVYNALGASQKFLRDAAHSFIAAGLASRAHRVVSFDCREVGDRERLTTELKQLQEGDVVVLLLPDYPREFADPLESVAPDLPTRGIGVIGVHDALYGKTGALGDRLFRVASVAMATPTALELLPVRSVEKAHTPLLSGLGRMAQQVAEADRRLEIPTIGALGEGAVRVLVARGDDGTEGLGAFADDSRPGRVVYFGQGHTDGTFRDPAVIRFLENAVRWVAREC
jgi:hypothetical protein